MGTEESKPNKKTKEINNSDTFNWVFCPNCYSVPSIKPFLVHKELFISIYCKCSYEEKDFFPFESYQQLVKSQCPNTNYCKKHKTTHGYLYCINCEKWLCKNCHNNHKNKNKNHLYNKIPLKLNEYCNKHENQRAVGYCFKCEKNVCEKCLEIQKKIRHDIFKFDDKTYEEKCRKKWDEFINFKIKISNNNKELKNDMIKLIKVSKEIKLEVKNLIINKIEDAYLQNTKINAQIIKFILFLFSNLDNSYSFGGIVNHNVFYNVLTNVKLDNSTFTIKQNSTNLIKHAAQLVNYFENIYLIKLNPLVNIKNIISERKNVTKQISKVCILDKYKAASLNSKGIIVVWNFYNYEEVYRIKNVHITENNNINNDPINPNQVLNNLNNDFDAINIINNLGTNVIRRRNNNNLNDNDEEDDEEMDVHQRANQRVIQQQMNILNVINNININRNNETKYMIKVFENTNSKYNLPLNLMNNCYHEKDISYPGDINMMFNRNQINEDEEDELDLNFTAMTFVAKYSLLVLVIEKFNEIFLFDVYNKKTFNRKLVGHTKEVLEVLALKNSDLASYGADNTLRIWNMKSYQNVTVINAEIKKYYIYFTQLFYGNLIFATNESTTKILKLPMYSFLPDITEVNKPMNFFELPDKRLIISSEDYTVKIFKGPDYKEVTMLFKKRIRIYSFLLLDKTRLLLGFENGSLNILFYNIKNYNNYVSVAEHYSPIGSLVKTKNDRVISLSWDDMTKIFLIGS